MKDEENNIGNEPSKENQKAPQEPVFMHQDTQSNFSHEPLTDEEIAAKKRKKRWMTIGIILIIVVGIPLLLFGTCFLLIPKG